MSNDFAGITYAAAFAAICVLQKDSPAEAEELLACALRDSEYFLSLGQLGEIEKALAEAPADFVYDRKALLISAAAGSCGFGFRFDYADPENPLDCSILSIVRSMHKDDEWTREWNHCSSINEQLVNPVRYYPPETEIRLLPTRFVLPGQGLKNLRDSSKAPSARLDLSKGIALELDFPCCTPEHLDGSEAFCRICRQTEADEARGVLETICECRIETSGRNARKVRLIPTNETVMMFSSACIKRERVFIDGGSAKRFPSFVLPAPGDSTKVPVRFTPEGLSFNDTDAHERRRPYMVFIPSTLFASLEQKYWWFNHDPDYTPPIDQSLYDDCGYDPDEFMRYLDKHKSRSF